jgi:malate synthase
MLEQIPKGASLHSSNVLTSEAIDFLTKLHRNFNPRRLDLLEKRKERQKQLDAGEIPTISVHPDRSWRIAPIPSELAKRHVEITGPTDVKMVINALNSGANVFMADFEDANVPTWKNLLEGQHNLMEAIDRKLSFDSPEGKAYRLKDETAVLMVRPRGWHLDEKHLQIDGEPTSGSLFDFGLYFFHNAKKLLKNGSGPYFYLPKLENHLEARLWNDVFIFAQQELGIPQGTIKATVLIETILAAFEMDLILYELKDHSAGLNAGRWDYIFSIIKKFRRNEKILFPDRAQITMTIPCMRAYTDLLVHTCHQRGAHAIGGMAAYIPNRKDKEVNEIAMGKVREDKKRETQDGFDGTWVAHPDLVSLAHESFTGHLGQKPNQLDFIKDKIQVSSSDLLNFSVTGGKITEEGIRSNIRVCLIYLESWLRGVGAVAINNLMEDAATAEISRSLLWQWLHNPHAKLNDGRSITKELYDNLTKDEFEKIKNSVPPEAFVKGKYAQAKKLLDSLTTKNEFEEFLTLLAYQRLDS